MQLMSEIDKETEIYDKRKSSSSYQDMRNKNVISFDNDVEQNIVNLDDKTKNDLADDSNHNDNFNLVDAMAKNSPIIKKVPTVGAENEQNKTNANNDLPSNATTPEPKKYVIQ